jgi:DNA-binding IclR family transcriptional regulator
LTETTRTIALRSSRPNTSRLGVGTNDAKRPHSRPGTGQGSHRESDGGVGSARRVLRILNEFCQNSPSPTAEELSQATNIPLSSVYRYLALLREANFIDEDGRNGFVVGPLAVRLARAAMLSMPMIELAQPYLQELTAKVGESTLLLVRSGIHAVCLARCESTASVRTAFDVGTTLPLHRGAGPKLLLAYLPKTEQQTILMQLKKEAPRSVSAVRQLNAELGQIAERGSASSISEVMPDVWSVAAPIMQGTEVKAALSVVAPAYRTPENHRQRLRLEVVRAAKRISERISDYSL